MTSTIAERGPRLRVAVDSPQRSVTLSIAFSGVKVVVQVVVQENALMRNLRLAVAVAIDALATRGLRLDDRRSR